jgi:ATP-binding cassette, subfamily B, multidrug efflux pump
MAQTSSRPSRRSDSSAATLQQRNHFQKVLRYLRPHWRQAALGILALLIVNGLGVYIPLLIRKNIDGLQQALSWHQLLQDAALILVLASVMWVIRVQSRILLFGVGRQVEFDLKQHLFQHLLTLEPDYFSTHTIGDLISRATSDVENIRRLLGFAVLSGEHPLCLRFNVAGHVVDQRAPNLNCALGLPLHADFGEFIQS